MDYIIVLLIMNLYFIIDIVNLWNVNFFNVFEFEYWLMSFFVVIISIRNSILFFLRIVIFNFFIVD